MKFSLILGAICGASAYDAASYDWTRPLSEAPDGPVLSWTVDGPNNLGKFALKCPGAAGGWCGFGVSPSGGMSFGDFVIGYLDSSASPVVSDYNHMKNTPGKPEVDLTSHLSDTNVEVIDDDLVLSFTRPLTNCDSQDLDILVGTTRVVWASGDSAPSSPDSVTYHNTNRGSKSLMLFLDPTISDATGMTLEEVAASDSHEIIDLMIGSANGGTDFVIPAYPAGGYAVEFYEPGTDYTELALTQGGIDKSNVHYRIPHDASNAISDKYDTIVGLGGGDVDLCDWDTEEYCTSSTGVGTMYWWKTFDLSYITEKTHITRYEPLLDPDTLKRTHHLLIYECGNMEEYIDYDGIGYSPTAPREVEACNVAAPIVVWAVGGGPFNFPEEAGYPIGPGFGKYFMIEMHYDSPPGEPASRDTSGVRLTTTTDLRQHDIGVIYSGSLLSDFITIPPGKESHDLHGYCTSESTSQMIPDGGTNIFAVLLHSHLAGRSIVLEHARGDEVLEPIAYDVHYDFNLQDINPIAPTRKLMPGDDLKVTCNYDTSDRSFITYGGLGTYDEMCLAYLYHYPRTELSACLSGHVSPGVHFGSSINTDAQPVLSKQFVEPTAFPSVFTGHLNCDCGECPEVLSVGEEVEQNVLGSGANALVIGGMTLALVAVVAAAIV